jgi:hypothetical protein
MRNNFRYAESGITEARRSCGTSRMLARDERAVCEVEQAWSKGGKGPTVSL